VELLGEELCQGNADPRGRDFDEAQQVKTPDHLRLARDGVPQTDIDVEAHELPAGDARLQRESSATSRRSLQLLARPADLEGEAVAQVERGGLLEPSANAGPVGGSITGR
jgi:hypothetical protein